MPVREAVSIDLPPLTQLWHDGWHDAHRAFVPTEILPFRIIETFAPRLPSMLEGIRVLGEPGIPLGFCYILENEIDQMFVHSTARGTTAARELLADGEARLRGNGVEQAWLSCVTGNHRAARFYEKNGWSSTKIPEAEPLTGAPELTVNVWRYKKILA